MWLIKMRQQKRQLLLIGLMLFAVAGLLSMSLCLTGELAGFAARSINETNSPDGYIFTVGTHNFTDHFTREDYRHEVEPVSALYGKAVTAPIRYQGKDITQLYDMMLSAEHWQDFGYLSANQEPEQTGGPSRGEVWLSEVLAVPNRIKPGDTIVIEYEVPLELIVSGTYKSTCFPKGIGYSPMLVHADDLSLAGPAKEAALFAVDIRDYSDDRLKEMFQDSSYSVVTRSRDDIRSSIMEYSASLSMIGAMAAGIVFFVALVIIWYMIKNHLLKEYRTIGIYKSLGYTSADIARFYCGGYYLTGIIAVISGILVSLWPVQGMGVVLTEYVGGFSVSEASLFISSGTFAVLMLLLFFYLTLAFRRMETITPVEAIAIGTTRMEQKLPPAVLRFAKTPPAMAVNEMFRYKRTTVMMISAITVSMFLSLFFQMVWYSTDMILENRNLWFCLPRGDVYVAGNINGELMDYLEQDQQVKSVVYGDFMIGYCKPEGYPDAPQYVGYDAYSDFTEAITGVKMIAGHGPQQIQEVAVGQNLLNLLHLDVGDPLTLTLGGITGDYIISGSFETISDRGRKIMMMTDAVTRSKDYTVSRAYVQLNSPGAYETFKAEVEGRFAGITADTRWFAMENSVDSIKGMIKSISSLLVIAFMAFSVLNVSVVLFMDMKNWYRKYGILKALGFTADYLIGQNVCKYAAIAAVSAITALLLHLLLSQKLAASMLLDAFVNSAVLMTAMLFSFIVLIILTSFVISLRIKKVSPLELMEE